MENNREGMLQIMLDATTQLSQLFKDKNIDLSLKRLSMDFYAGTGNEKKLIPAVLNYAEDGLMKMDIDSLKAEDEASYKQFREPYLTGKADSTKKESWAMINRMMRCKNMIIVSYGLRDAAEAVFKGVEDKKALIKATEWARQSSDFFSHFSTQSVYAALLYKTGKKQKAIEMMQQAASDPFIMDQPDLRKLMLDNVDQIKKGKVLEKLWIK